jgi:hypothetical protein
MNILYHVIYKYQPVFRPSIQVVIEKMISQETDFRILRATLIINTLRLSFPLSANSLNQEVQVYTWGSSPRIRPDNLRVPAPDANPFTPTCKFATVHSASDINIIVCSLSFIRRFLVHLPPGYVSSRRSTAFSCVSWVRMPGGIFPGRNARRSTASSCVSWIGTLFNDIRSQDNFPGKDVRLISPSCCCSIQASGGSH